MVDFGRFFLEGEMNLDFTLCSRIIENVSRVIVGKSDVLELVLVALLADGHLLLEDVPGVGKTLIAKALAQSFGGLFKRVQFTPDLLPGDITGFNIYDQRSGQFHFQEGPVITNILLADEINRAIPRTQSSLLESMEERQVTIDGTTYPLPKPFLVMATQNPIELEGTFPLPEAQLDRFLLKIQVGYPQKERRNLDLGAFSGRRSPGCSQAPGGSGATRRDAAGSKIHPCLQADQKLHHGYCQGYQKQSMPCASEQAREVP